MEDESRLCQNRETDLGDDDSVVLCLCLLSLGPVVAATVAVVEAASVADTVLADGEMPGALAVVVLVSAIGAIGAPEPSVPSASSADDWGSEPRHRGCIGASTWVRLGVLKADPDRKLIPLISLRGEDENDDRGDDGEELDGVSVVDWTPGALGILNAFALDADMGMGHGSVVAAGEWDLSGCVVQRASDTIDELLDTDVSAVMLFSSKYGSSSWDVARVAELAC